MSSDTSDSTEVSLVEEDEDGIVVLHRTQPSSKFNSWHRKRNVIICCDAQADKSSGFYLNFVTLPVHSAYDTNRPSVCLSVFCLSVVCNVIAP